jgi:polyhydroxyalkanoate synthase
MQTMLNSPKKKNASFFINKALSGEADAWLEQAELQQGSWWLYWRDWIQSRSLAKKKAPLRLGNKAYLAGVAAPGEYVYQQSE